MKKRKADNKKFCLLSGNTTSFSKELVMVIKLEHVNKTLNALCAN